MLMFPFPVTAHGPNAAWEREKALPDKTLPGSKCFFIFIFIIIPKNSNSTQTILPCKTDVRQDRCWAFSPHHSFYSAKQTMWKGSNWNLQRPTWTAEIIPTHESNLMQEEEQLSMSKLSTTGYSFRGSPGWSMSPSAGLHVCIGGACRTGSDSWVSQRVHLVHTWSEALDFTPWKGNLGYLLQRQTVIQTGICTWGHWKNLPSNCASALNQNTPRCASGIRTTGT